jgi:hypothetical protein
LIGKLKEGKRGFTPKRTDAGPKKHIIKQRRMSTRLCPPAKPTLPWDEYQELYDVKLMKKAGHKKTTINGVEVVVMPAAKGTPWLLKDEYGHDVCAQEVDEACGSSDGFDSDDCPLDRKFNDLLKAAWGPDSAQQHHHPPPRRICQSQRQCQLG